MKELLQGAFDAAIRAADADVILGDYLPEERSRSVTVIGAGKGAAKMAAAFESHWDGPVRGLVVTRYGHRVPTKSIEVVEAAHPVPDQAGVEASKRMLDLIRPLGAGDLVVALISGGGSALLSLPVDGVTVAQKQELNQALLESGATIDEINCVRKHLSAIKGGRLAQACHPAQLLTLAISDVAGDDPAVIASGPTVGDPSTCEDAQSILQRYAITGYDALLQESVKLDAACVVESDYRLIATPQKSLKAAQAYLQDRGVKAYILSDRIEGEAREVAKMHAALVHQIQAHGEPFKRPCVLLSGGEATVSIKNKNGCGGPNGEFVLSLLDQLQGGRRVYALAADTDGIDGSEDNAGAWLDPKSYARMQAKGLSAQRYLDDNRSYAFFRQMGDLFVPGPTLTNVNDFRAIYIE